MRLVGLALTKRQGEITPYDDIMMIMYHNHCTMPVLTNMIFFNYTFKFFFFTLIFSLRKIPALNLIEFFNYGKKEEMDRY
jgi:hypothetical protein